MQAMAIPKIIILLYFSSTPPNSMVYLNSEQLLREKERYSCYRLSSGLVISSEPVTISGLTISLHLISGYTTITEREDDPIRGVV